MWLIQELKTREHEKHAIQTEVPKSKMPLAVRLTFTPLCCPQFYPEKIFPQNCGIWTIDQSQKTPADLADYMSQEVEIK